jgi:hypothetical protein
MSVYRALFRLMELRPRVDPGQEMPDTPPMPVPTLARLPLPPFPSASLPSAALAPLAAELEARAGDVLAITVARTNRGDHTLDTVVQESFERLSTSSTIAVARLMAGESLEVVQATGHEASQIFGDIAAR